MNYIFRVAISNHRILKLEHGHVTFKYKESVTQQIRFCTLTAAEFMRRFLQHVLPDRFVKVRYYGLLSPANRHLLEKARALLATAIKLKSEDVKATEAPAALRCPYCGGPLTLLGPLAPKGRPP